MLLKAVGQVLQRCLREELKDRPVIGSWTALIDYLQAAMQHDAAEHFRLLFLDRKNILIRDEVQSRGTVDHTPLYPREVVKRALELGASAIIMVHNHPSGDPTPSQADIDMTRQVIGTGPGQHHGPRPHHRRPAPPYQLQDAEADLSGAGGGTSTARGRPRRIPGDVDPDAEADKAFGPEPTCSTGRRRSDPARLHRRTRGWHGGGSSHRPCQPRRRLFQLCQMAKTAAVERTERGVGGDETKAVAACHRYPDPATIDGDDVSAATQIVHLLGLGRPLAGRHSLRCDQAPPSGAHRHPPARQLHRRCSGGGLQCREDAMAKSKRSPGQMAVG